MGDEEADYEVVEQLSHMEDAVHKLHSGVSGLDSRLRRVMAKHSLKDSARVASVREGIRLRVASLLEQHMGTILLKEDAYSSLCGSLRSAEEAVRTTAEEAAVAAAAAASDAKKAVHEEPKPAPVRSDTREVVELVTKLRNAELREARRVGSLTTEVERQKEYVDELQRQVEEMQVDREELERQLLRKTTAADTLLTEVEMRDEDLRMLGREVSQLRKELSEARAAAREAARGASRREEKARARNRFRAKASLIGKLATLPSSPSAGDAAAAARPMSSALSVRSGKSGVSRSAASLVALHPPLSRSGSVRSGDLSSTGMTPRGSGPPTIMSTRRTVFGSGGTAGGSGSGGGGGGGASMRLQMQLSEMGAVISELHVKLDEKATEAKRWREALLMSEEDAAARLLAASEQLQAERVEAERDRQALQLRVASLQARTLVRPEEYNVEAALAWEQGFFMDALAMGRDEQMRVLYENTAMQREEAATRRAYMAADIRQLRSQLETALTDNAWLSEQLRCTTERADMGREEAASLRLQLRDTQQQQRELSDRFLRRGKAMDDLRGEIAELQAALRERVTELQQSDDALQAEMRTVRALRSRAEAAEAAAAAGRETAGMAAEELYGCELRRSELAVSYRALRGRMKKARRRLAVLEQGLAGAMGEEERLEMEKEEERKEAEERLQAAAEAMRGMVPRAELSALQQRCRQLEEALAMAGEELASRCQQLAAAAADVRRWQQLEGARQHDLQRLREQLQKEKAAQLRAVTPAKASRRQLTSAPTSLSAAGLQAELMEWTARAASPAVAKALTQSMVSITLSTGVSRDGDVEDVDDVDADDDVDAKDDEDGGSDVHSVVVDEEESGEEDDHDSFSEAAADRQLQLGDNRLVDQVARLMGKDAVDREVMLEALRQLRDSWQQLHDDLQQQREVTAMTVEDERAELVRAAARETAAALSDEDPLRVAKAREAELEGWLADLRVQLASTQEELDAVLAAADETAASAAAEATLAATDAAEKAAAELVAAHAATVDALKAELLAAQAAASQALAAADAAAAAVAPAAAATKVLPTDEGKPAASPRAAGVDVGCDAMPWAETAAVACQTVVEAVSIGCQTDAVVAGPATRTPAPVLPPEVAGAEEMEAVAVEEEVEEVEEEVEEGEKEAKEEEQEEPTKAEQKATPAKKTKPVRSRKVWSSVERSSTAAGSSARSPPPQAASSRAATAGADSGSPAKRVAVRRARVRGLEVTPEAHPLMYSVSVQTDLPPASPTSRAPAAAAAAAGSSTPAPGVKLPPAKKELPPVAPVAPGLAVRLARTPDENAKLTAEVSLLKRRNAALEAALERLGGKLVEVQDAHTAEVLASSEADRAAHDARAELAAHNNELHWRLLDAKGRNRALKARAAVLRVDEAAVEVEHLRHKLERVTAELHGARMEIERHRRVAMDDYRQRRMRATGTIDLLTLSDTTTGLPPSPVTAGGPPAARRGRDASPPKSRRHKRELSRSRSRASSPAPPPSATKVTATVLSDAGMKLLLSELVKEITQLGSTAERHHRGAATRMEDVLPRVEALRIRCLPALKRLLSRVRAVHGDGRGKRKKAEAVKRRSPQKAGGRRTRDAGSSLSSALMTMSTSTRVRSEMVRIGTPPTSPDGRMSR
eukprot:PLAT4358.6.p1 GENE.PLAT4358.6~~PLAT4358.6.p1  ORF type:complete len:1656 (-),score=744.22 PLAT4358.6:286-5211(-)